jgi:hypothetical protein
MSGVALLVRGWINTAKVCDTQWRAKMGYERMAGQHQHDMTNIASS